MTKEVYIQYNYFNNFHRDQHVKETQNNKILIYIDMYGKNQHIKEPLIKKFG